jgi:ribulose-bisphosphate carboxylase large chain
MATEVIIVTYALAFKIEPVERAIDLLLAEMTSGIQYYATRSGVKMDRVQDTLSFVNESVHGSVVSVKRQDEEVYRTVFSLPADNLDVAFGGITVLWPMIAGEVFNFHFIKRAELVDVHLPQSFTRYYGGPGFGVKGIRDLVDVTDRPLFGSIIKPNLGLDPGLTAEKVATLAQAGFDFVKDDEICVSPAVCPLEERVRAVSRVVQEMKQKHGKNIIYAANVTSDISVLEKAAATAVKAGATGLMIDPFCTGLSGIDFLKRNFGLPIYAHRVGYGIYCGNPTFSIAYDVFCTLFRILGADFSHVGGIWGKSADGRKKVADYVRLLRKDTILPQTWPVVTGISLDNMNDYYQFFGDETMFMDHIDIYRDPESSRNKLHALKERVGLR